MPLNDEWMLDRLLEISQAVEANATTLKRQAEDIRGLKPLFDRVATLETWRNGHEQWKDKELGNLRSDSNQLEDRVKTIETWKERHQQQTDDYVENRTKQDQQSERENERRFQVEHTRHLYMPLWLQVMLGVCTTIFTGLSVFVSWYIFVHQNALQHLMKGN